MCQVCYLYMITVYKIYLTQLSVKLLNVYSTIVTSMYVMNKINKTALGMLNRR